MKDFLKKQWDILAIILIIGFLVFLNIRPNFVIMGLDNASPYFDLGVVLSRIKGTSSIIYGGILFQSPFLYPFIKLGLSPAIISNIYLFFNLITGVLGIYLISSSLSKKKLPRIIASLIFLTSLLTVWIFSQPNFLFIAAFGTIPLLIYLLGQRKRTLLYYAVLIFFTISFITTSLNIVAFFLYLFQILLLVKVLYPKTELKFLLIWSISLILFWLITLQITTIVNGDTAFILLNIFDYIKGLLNNPTVREVSEGIIASEKTNSLIHTLSFSLGWTELHDTQNVPIFEFYNGYRQNLFYLSVGAIPTLTALGLILKEKGKRILFLTLLLVSFILISSKYGITLIEQIPYISDSLRWVSSKIWPIFIIPVVSLNTLLFSSIFKNSKGFLKYGISILFISLLTFYAYPILNGNLLSSKTLVDIPEAYFELPEDSNILVLPEPQALYMREYNWGYYGSDFLSYINSSTFVDGSNLYESGPMYSTVLESREVPENIDFILYDKSAQSSQEYPKLLEGFRVINSNRYYTLYER